jgi:hypothetical protein
MSARVRTVSLNEPPARTTLDVAEPMATAAPSPAYLRHAQLDAFYAVRDLAHPDGGFGLRGSVDLVHRLALEIDAGALGRDGVCPSLRLGADLAFLPFARARVTPLVGVGAAYDRSGAPAFAPRGRLGLAVHAARGLTARVELQRAVGDAVSELRAGLAWRF